MSSASTRPSEVNAAGPVGPPSSSTVSADVPCPQQQQASTPTLNNLLRGDSAAAAMYIQQQQGAPHQVPSHVQHMMVPPQASFQSPQPSPIPNGSYSSPGSAGQSGGKAKPKGSSRPASRDVVFSTAAGQGGPPPQIPPMQNPAVLGLRMEAPPESPSSPAQGYSAAESAQHAAAVAAQQQQMQQATQQQLNAAAMQQQPPGYPPGMYPTGYWPPQQPQYGLPPGAALPAHYYHHPGQPQVPQSAFSYSMHGGRAMLPAAKIVSMPPIEMQRLPNGPAAADWQAKMSTSKLPSQETPSAAVSRTPPCGPGLAIAAPSPGGASSAADESLDDAKSLRGGSPASWPHTPAQLSQGQRTPVPPGQPPTPGLSGSAKSREAPSSIVDKLVGPVTATNPQSVMRERRHFFEKLVQFCESQGEPITQVPQVSKQVVDLHRLYIAVVKRGGFEQVTRDKTWKQLCTEANSEMSESSAAGYQLRRHYQKYLLRLECLETGKSATEAVAFAEKLKKKKRPEKEQPPNQQYRTPGPPGQTPPTHPGYGAHPGDPNAAYYYGHQMDPSSMQGRPQAPPGWPPQSYPGAPGIGGGPPGYPAGMRSVAPIRAPMPQQMIQPGNPMEEQQRYEEQQRQHYFQQQQQAAAFPSQQQQQPPMASSATPSSSLQVESSSCQSRAPSAGPPAGSATPDGSSRLSAEDSMPHRPPSHSQPSNATPSSTPGVPPVSQQPPQPSVGYYGQAQPPQLYGSPGMRTGGGPGVGMQMKPATGYPPGYPQPQPGGYPSVHGYPEGYQPTHPGIPPQQQHALYQQQMWSSQQAQRYPAAHAGMPPSSSAATPPMSGTMSMRGAVANVDMSASQQAYGAARRPPYYHMPPVQGAAIPPTGAPSPGAPSAAARMRYAAPPASTSSSHQQSQAAYPPQSSVPPGAARALPIGAPVGYPHMAPSTSATGIAIAGMQSSLGGAALSAASTSSAGGRGFPGCSGSMLMSASMVQYPPSQPMQFPAGSVEATTISQRRRRKLLSKDLIRADVRRLTMALRSGLETETAWALNALNVLLYDDMAVPLNLNHAPALLNVLVEHFRALLSLLFPRVFKVSSESKVRTVDDESDYWTASVKGDRSATRSMVAPRACKNEPTNFTKISRTGRTVHVEKKDFPDVLRRARPEGWQLDAFDATFSADYHQEKVSRGLGCSTSSYVVSRLLNEVESRKKVKTPFFSIHRLGEGSSASSELDRVVENDHIIKSTRVIEACDSKADENTGAVELKTLRPTALCIRDESRVQIVLRCLSISNILRGFSFLPGNEGPMSRHPGLLMILGRLLRLCAEERSITRPKALSVKQEAIREDCSPSSATGSLSEATRRLMAPGELLEPDDDDALLLFECAGQLREDTFVIFTHLSVQLDLLEVDSEISWPIFDGLIHWCVSKCAEAKDPLLPGTISPRNYALDTLCKMSVVERNVDLLISTGPWSRIEEFIKVIANLLSLNEEHQYREFAIVILNAICAASEPACVVTASDTPAVHYLVAFLEMNDSSMHQVVQHQGMQALRENPELMGTSVGMLRRTASLMQHLCKVPACRKYFVKHQQRLLQFTMSQLMDSRVGAMIADILYEVQKGIWEEQKEREESDGAKEGKHQTPAVLKTDETSQDASAASEESLSDAGEDTKVEISNKRESDENGIPKVIVEEVDVVDGEKKMVKEASPPPLKKQRVENGTLQNHVHKNGGSGGSAQKQLVNGDAPSPPMKPVNALPASRKNPTTPASVVENGTGATPTGSIQAVA